MAWLYRKNDRDAYTINNITAAKEADGGVTIQFGACGDGAANCLPIFPGWNYTMRLHRPRREIIDGGWTFPEVQPAH